MTAAQKFLFETSFDGATVESGDEARNKPVYTEADLDDARTQAFAEGRAAGAEEAKQEVAQRAEAALETIAEKLKVVEETRAEALTQAQEAGAQVALMVARKVLPEMTRRHGFEEIEGLVRECVAQLRDEPRIVVRVHDSMLDMLRQRIDQVTTGYTGKVVLLANPNLNEIDCRVEWADGGAERTGEQIWQEIDRVIERTFKTDGATSAAARDDQQ